MIYISIILSLSYWVYLGTHTQMQLAQDALGYEFIGRDILNHGFFNHYFTNGPNREPVYPLLVAFSMHIEALTRIAYTQVMSYLGIAMLLVNELCLWRILSILNIHKPIIALSLLYMGFSPAINNSAFSLYSEIAAFPFILPLILATHYYCNSIKKSRYTIAVTFAVIQSILLFYLTMVKASFEIIAPMYLVIINLYIWRKHNIKPMRLFLCTIISLIMFFIPVTAYKNLNKIHNGHYAITNRASWALYGNTARRMEPLNTERLLTSLAYVPGYGFCTKFFTKESCSFWSFTTSDAFGMTMTSKLANESLSDEQINTSLLKQSAAKAFHNPFQYGFLTILEGIKMFFWESTQIGFVKYPPLLTKVYANAFFKDILRLVISLITIVCVFFMWQNCFKKETPVMIFSVGILIFLYISIYSFFFILTRYALPIAPFFIIAIAYTANFLYNKRHAKH